MVWDVLLGLGLAWLALRAARRFAWSFSGRLRLRRLRGEDRIGRLPRTCQNGHYIPLNQGTWCRRCESYPESRNLLEGIVKR